MRKTTICYIEKNGSYLMLHRTKKKNDMSQDLYLGVGGKFEQGETADECNLREVREETGLILTDSRMRGLMLFESDKYETEYMYIYTATEYAGEINWDCNEGDLMWIPKKEVPDLPIWEGDKIFFRLLDEDLPFFYILAHYDANNQLAGYEVDRDADQAGAEEKCRERAGW